MLSLPDIDKFKDLKLRFLSSIGLVIFAVLFFFSPMWLISLIILTIYGVLVYEWHKASLDKRTIFDFCVFWYISLGVFAFWIISILRFIPSANDMYVLPLIWAILCAVLSDIGAYFTGRIFGGYHPFKSISPNKTISGYLGGLIIGSICPLLTALVLQGKLLHFSFIIYLLLIGISLTTASMAGDLLQSYFKRCHNIKDTGTYLPGHGGLFDRFDGILGASLMMIIVSIIFYIQI